MTYRLAILYQMPYGVVLGMQGIDGEETSGSKLRAPEDISPIGGPSLLLSGDFPPHASENESAWQCSAAASGPVERRS